MIRIIIIFFLLFLCLVLTLGLLFFIYYSITALLLRRAPFVPVRKAIVPFITKALELKTESILYDLGCGDGRVLADALRHTPTAHGIGFDINAIAILLATMSTRKLPVRIQKRDMYTVDLSSATHIFCYLFPSMLQKLETKILSECKPGTRIVCCDFTFPTLVPVETSELPANQYQTCKKLYIYTL